MTQFDFTQTAVQFSQNLVDATLKGNAIVIEGFEKLSETQIKSFNQSVSALNGFVGELKDLRDPSAYTQLWPKSIELLREQFESNLAAGNEVFEQLLKTSEQLSSLAKHSAEQVAPEALKQAKVVKAPKAA